MSRPIGVVAVMTAKPGAKQDLISAMREITTEIERTEPGCTHFSVYEHPEQPDQVWVMERYADDAALTAHRAAPHMTTIAPRIRDNYAAIDITFLDGV